MNVSPHDRAFGFEPITLPADEPPRLFVVVDTEEEFDWSAPFRRENTNVSAIPALTRLQARLDRFGLKPTYVIDYPVATKPEAYPVLRTLAHSHQCEIGAHLHPWVTPPFEETVNRTNSFACNL